MAAGLTLLLLLGCPIAVAEMRVLGPQKLLDAHGGRPIESAKFVHYGGSVASGSAVFLEGSEICKRTCHHRSELRSKVAGKIIVVERAKIPVRLIALALLDPSLARNSYQFHLCVPASDGIALVSCFDSAVRSGSKLSLSVPVGRYWTRFVHGVSGSRNCAISPPHFFRSESLQRTTDGYA